MVYTIYILNSLELGEPELDFSARFSKNCALIGIFSLDPSPFHWPFVSQSTYEEG